jgi:hypothetical protein
VGHLWVVLPLSGGLTCNSEILAIDGHSRSSIDDATDIKDGLSVARFPGEFVTKEPWLVGRLNYVQFYIV